MNRAQNGFKDQMRISEDFVIGKAQNTIAAAGQEARANLVAGGGGIAAMLVAVQLDDQPAGGAKEVRNIGADGLLPTETDRQLAITQDGPEQPLGIGCAGAQNLRQIVAERAAPGMRRFADHRSRRADARTPPRNLLRKFRPSLKGRV